MFKHFTNVLKYAIYDTKHAEMDALCLYDDKAHFLRHRQIYILGYSNVIYACYFTCFVAKRMKFL